MEKSKIKNQRSNKHNKISKKALRVIAAVVARIVNFCDRILYLFAYVSLIFDI